MKRAPFFLIAGVLSASFIGAASAQTAGSLADLFANGASWLPAQVLIESGERASQVRIAPAERSSDGRVRLSGDVPQGARWIWVRIARDEESHDAFARVEGRREFEIATVLRFGPGEYVVQVLAARGGETPYGISYRQLASFRVRNENPADLRYLAPSPMIESEDPGIQALARQITAGARTDRERALALHDWVAANIDYDVKAYLASLRGQPIAGMSATEALRVRLAVCNGYANLMAALARAVGIPARVVEGQSIWAKQGQRWQDLPDPARPNHAWNELFVEGRWMSVDTTWDAGWIDLERSVFVRALSRAYFDPSASELARDHRALRLATD